MATVGENIRRVRKSRDPEMTQQALAEKLKLKSVGNISTLEKSDALPDPPTIQRYANALGCEPGELLKGVITPWDRLRALTKSGAPSDTSGLDRKTESDISYALKDVHVGPAPAEAKAREIAALLERLTPKKQREAQAIFAALVHGLLAAQAAERTQRPDSKVRKISREKSDRSRPRAKSR